MLMFNACQVRNDTLQLRPMEQAIDNCKLSYFAVASALAASTAAFALLGAARRAVGRACANCLSCCCELLALQAASRYLLGCCDCELLIKQVWLLRAVGGAASSCWPRRLLQVGGQATAILLSGCSEVLVGLLRASGGLLRAVGQAAASYYPSLCELLVALLPTVGELL